MKIGILSREQRSYSTGRLVEASRQRGHTARVLDTLDFMIGVEHRNPRLLLRNRPVPRYDAIIPRIGASITFFGLAVVRQLEQQGLYLLNSSRAIAASRDKLRSLQELSRHDIGMPATAFARRREDILPAIAQVGGAPVIIKLLEGTQGIGVILAETEKVAEAIIETLQSTRQSVLIQKFVAECRGRDIRAFVVGDRVVAAIRRSAVGHEFRSNVHRGGRTETVQLDAACETMAVRAAHVLGLQVAGVDILEGTSGPLVLEVNSSPGLEGIEAASGVDVAGAIIEHMEDHVSFPEIDLRHRLTLKSGYGVVETVIDSKSRLANRTIADCGLREQDVLVLVIERPDAVIPNPRPQRKLMAGDRVLFFGNRETLKTLIPARRKRKSDA